MSEYHRIGADKPLRGEDSRSVARKSEAKTEARGVKKPVRSSSNAIPQNYYNGGSGSSQQAPLPSIRKEKMATPARSIEQPPPRREMYQAEIEVILDGGDEENDVDVLKHMRNIREQNDLRNGKSVITSYARPTTNVELKTRSVLNICRYLPFKQGRIYTPIQIQNGLVPEVTNLRGEPNYKSDIGLDKLIYPENPQEVEVVLLTSGTKEHVGLEIAEIVNWNTSRNIVNEPIANYMAGIIHSRGLIPGIVKNCRLVDGMLLSEAGTCTVQVLSNALSNCITRSRTNQNLAVIVLPIKADVSQVQHYLSDLRKLGVFVLMPGVFTVGGYDYQRLQPLNKESADIYLPGKNVISLGSKEYYTVLEGDVAAYAQLAGIIAVLTQKLLSEVDEEGNPKYKTRAERYEVIEKMIMEQYSYCPREGYRIFRVA